MTERCYLGIDLGAESGRVTAGLFDGGRVRVEELHRFPNGAVPLAGSLRWDVLRLWDEVQQGLAKAAAAFGARVASVGVDTWGVDYVLLSRHGELVGMPYCYRDGRTRGMLDHALSRVSRGDIFSQTGIQFMEINTLFQLVAAQQKTPEVLQAADRFLMIPDFFNWCLAGSRAAEFTNATTTQCFHPVERNWAFDLLKKLSLPPNLFPEVVPPGTRLGPLRETVASQTGLGRIEVIAPATHDTGSAVAAVPTRHTGRMNWAYLSSGTWSLLGVEVPQAVLSPRALELNLTNEGGIDGTWRLLKNIMGLWLVQECRRAFARKGRDLDYATLTRLASAAPPFRSLVDPDDPSLLNPPDMPVALQELCRKSGQPAPETEGQLVRCALEGLALKYPVVLGWLEEMTGEPVEALHIVGGGARNRLLNQFTASACHRPVLAGPVEATVLGNVLVQARSAGEIGSLRDLREVVRQSSELQEFEPAEPERWQEAAERFQRVIRAQASTP